MTRYRSAAVVRSIGVSLGHRTLAEADHWILALDPPPRLACTHLVPEPYRHVAISLTAVLAGSYPTLAGSYPTEPSL